MDDLDKASKKVVKKVQAMNKREQLKTIQAMADEGVTFPVTMDSLLTGTTITGTTILGTTNEYKSYSKQVSETCKKYNGDSDLGGPQVRAVVDIRAAFEAGEGLSIAGDFDKETYGKFFEDFLDNNKLTSTKLFALAKRLEKHGRALTCLKKGNDDTEQVPYFGVYNGKNLWTETPDQFFPELGREYFDKQSEDNKIPLKVNFPVLIITGGDGEQINNTTTKVGLVLSECDNYDRATKNMREINYNTARITPVFKTAGKTETDQCTQWINDNVWKRGDAFIGTATLTYETPGSGAITNLESELATSVKTISGTTGVPVHWLGYVDMMSNRATAEELYQSVNNATIMERAAIEAAFKEILINAQELYIDTGGPLFKEIFKDISVKLPLIDLGRFKAMIEAYEKLYLNDIISKETFRNVVPGVDPILEAEIEEAEDKKAEAEAVKKSDPKIILDIDEDEGDNDGREET